MPLSTEDVWHRFHDALRGFITRAVTDPALADDLVQETFVRIHRGLESLDDDERVGAWVHRIARRAIADHWRRRRPSPRPLEVDDAPTGLSPEADDAGRELSRCAGELVEALPETYRETVRLADLEGVTHREIAERLGVSVSGVKSRVHRGRAELRRLLLRCCRLELDRAGGILAWERRAGCAETCDDPGAGDR